MNFAKLANSAMVCEFGNVIANLANGLRIWQGGCEFGKVVCEVGKAVAKLAMVLRSWQWLRISLASEILCEKRSSQWVVQVWVANFAMCTEIANSLRNSQGLRIDCQLFANFARVANWLPTDCENPVLLFFHSSRHVFNCISFLPFFLCFSIDFWAC